MKTELQREEVSATGSRFAIVVSRWNGELTSKLERGAIEALTGRGAGVDAIEIFRVPGAFELPLLCKRAASSGNFDAVIAVGVVIRGETPHFEYVAGQAAAGIMQAGLETGIPILFGVITADTHAQALDRCGEREDNKGYEAALSAVEMVNLFREMAGRKEQGARVFPHVV